MHHVNSHSKEILVGFSQAFHKITFNTLTFFHLELGFVAVKMDTFVAYFVGEISKTGHWINLGRMRKECVTKMTSRLLGC
jgi:hypothetical protein